MMKLTKQTVVIILLIVVLVLVIVFAYRIDGFCNCSGFGVQVDKPTNTFWRGAWPRNKSVIDLNSASRWGTYPAGCNSPGLGWPQMSEQPFSRNHYDYASISDPYAIGSNEIRDLARDEADGLLNAKIEASSSYGQQMYEIPYDRSTIPTSSKCCDCRPTNGVQSTGRFLPLSAIPYSQLPPGAVTTSDPPTIGVGTSRYNDLYVGVL